MFDPSDSEPSLSMNNQVDFEGMPKNFIKFLKEAQKIVDEMVETWSKGIKDTESATGKMGESRPGAGRLGLGSFTRAEKVGIGLGLAAFGASTYAKMAPNTMAAVTQRMGADTYAGLSGMSSRQAIMQANGQVGGGATSAMGPTMAAMNLMYQGGYTASSKSSQNIMSQIGGLSAMSGMSNESAAASMAGMNGMSFLRAGIRIRDPQGNLKPPNTIINDVYSFLYRGQKITKQQAAMVLNPGSKGYATIQQITGGDPQLMQMIQSGILARASNGKPLTSSQMQDPNKVLNAMGVDQNSPIRANFRFNSSENRKLASTEQGLVGGYDASLRTAASLNDQYSKMADTLGPVNDGLMTLKGILQTFPNAGGIGGVAAGVVGTGVGLATNYMGYKVLDRALGHNTTKKIGNSLFRGAINFIKNPKNLLKVGGLVGAGALAPETGGASLAAAAAMFGAGFTGGPNDHGNLGIGGPNDNSSTPTPFSSPVPKATPITSPFGPRDNSGHPGISANHKGIDFGTPSGTALTAVTSGIVSTLGNEAKGYGQWIEVKHDDGTASRYAHMSQINVSRGQKVGPGQVLGRSGGKKGQVGAGNSTGAHLHFEILNEKGVKVNPAPYLSGAPAGPIGTNVTSSAAAGPKAISSDSMWSAKKSIAKGRFKGKNVAQLSSPTLSSSLTSSGFNEDVGGPIEGMNIGVNGSTGSHNKNVIINLQMKVNIAQGSVQEADRLVRLIGKKLTDSNVLKQIGSSL